MSDPVLKFVQCPDADGSHRMAYWQWGDASAQHVVICVHGLTRQGRDFDTLARALLASKPAGLCVICPDVVGRGRSDWLKQAQAYQIPTYAADMLVLINALQARRLDWVGTSMGGLIGIVIAGQQQMPAHARVERLILNDVGPVLEWPALQRIGRYVGQVGVFDSAQQAADALWAIASGFGPHTPEQWLALSRPCLKPLGNGSGRMTLHYDPALAEPFKAMNAQSAAQGEALLWQLYDQIKARTLLMRGAQSDLLSPQTALAMTQRGPRARWVEFEGVGHAPTFIPHDQVQQALGFLLTDDTLAGV